MKTKFLPILILAAFLSAGCETDQASSSGGSSVNKNYKPCLVDLNGDAVKEVVYIDEKSDCASGAVIRIKNRDQTEIDSLKVPGRFKNLKFIELNNDGQKQIAVYFEGENNFINLAIYQLKNDRLFKMFSAESEYGIDAEFGSAIPRIKIGKGRSENGEYSANYVSEVDTWIWDGTKFIKDSK